MTDYDLTLAVFDSGEARTKLREATAIILALEKDYEAAVRNAADAEAVYRRELAGAFGRYRKEGMAVAEAETTARAEVAMHSHERDVTGGLLKLAGERIENARDTRRSLWRLVEWARQRDAAAGKAPDDERAPAASWPS
jgi:hypothetical protein